MKLKTILNQFSLLDLIATIWFNFRYLKIAKAVHLPIITSYKLRVLGLKRGGVIVDGKFAKVRLGFSGNANLIDSSVKLFIQGRLIFRGSARIGTGTRILVHENAELIIGDGFLLTGNTLIDVSKRVEIGDNCMFSYGVTIMDNDGGHRIVDFDGNVLNNDEPITIGKHVWVCSDSKILKGSKINDDIVIAANSVISSELLTSYSVYISKCILKQNINWFR